MVQTRLIRSERNPLNQLQYKEIRSNSKKLQTLAKC